MKYAKVAVEAANYSFDTEFTYIIPGELTDKVMPGCRVTVPFGSGNRKSLGIVFEVTDERPEGKLKRISELRDETPLLSEEMLALARNIADKTFCTLYEAAKAMLPAGINCRIVKFYAANPDASQKKLEKLEGAEKEVYDFLLARGEFVREDLIFKNLSHRTGIILFICLCTKRVDCRSLGQIQHAGLDKGLINIFAHLTAQGIQLFYQMSLAGPANIRVARHQRDTVHADRKHNRFLSKPCCCQRSLTAGMACADNDYIVFLNYMRHRAFLCIVFLIHISYK